ncbi:uncharacterized protein LOC111031526, partial [Myzus persicae]|uniref:uncharacterized protein LOC111031526 n=1 Tax=Myzus persicae TaxID=13164 RepID=UPI000B935F26
MKSLAYFMIISIFHIPQIYTQQTPGIIFTKQRNIMFGSGHWTIVINNDVKPLYKKLEYMKQLLIMLPQYKTEDKEQYGFVIEKFSVDIQFINEGIHNYIDDVNQIFNLLPKIRNKRGLINAVGSTFKFLFGTATNYDIDEINLTLSNINETTNEIQHLQQSQITIIQNINKNEYINTIKMNEIIKHLNDGALSIETMKTMIISLNQDIKIISFMIRTEKVVRLIENFLQDAKLELDKIKQGLITSLYGKLSPNLISTNKFVDILTDIKNKMPQKLDMIIPVTSNNIHVYYQIAILNSFADDKSLKLVIQIPITSNEGNFELYSVQALPIFMGDLNKWAKLDTIQDYLAISDDRKSYSIISQNQLENCNKQIVTICNHRAIIKRGESCEYNAFLGRNTSGFCNKSINELLESEIFIPSDNGVHFSVKREIDKIKKCWVKTGLNIYNYKIKEAGILLDTENCEISTSLETIKILPRVQKSTQVNINMSISLINISTIFSDTELLKIKNYKQELRSSIYKPIENINIKGSDFIDVDNMLTTMSKNYNQKKNIMSYNDYIIIVLISIIAIIIVLLIVLYKKIKKLV